MSTTIIKKHYKDLEGLSKQLSPPVQLFCKDLVENGIFGRLEIYPNEDIDFKSPDVVYNIKQAAEHANCRYTQKGLDYDQIDIPARVVACIYAKRAREAYTQSWGVSI